MDDLSFQLRNNNSKMASMEREKLVHLEEIKLLKDYVYGLDQKAK